MTDQNSTTTGDQPTGLMARALAPRTRWVLIFVLIYIAAAFAAAIVFWNPEFIFYTLAVVLIVVLVGYMDARVQFSGLALWGLALWGLVHLAGGQTPIPPDLAEPGTAAVLYNLRLVEWLPKYDQLVHAFGFGAATIAAYEAMCAHFGRRLPIGWAIGSVLFLVGLGLGAVNEIIEFTTVLMVPDTNVGGYRNTAWDLVSNGFGALAAVWILKQRRV